MTRALATVRRIAEIKPIEGADKICAYAIDGWWVVDTIGKYTVGDLAVYLEIDSWVPSTIANFLSKGKEPRVYEGVQGERLRTVKLKKQVSQGLLLPLSVTDGHVTSELLEGVDVTEELGILKWEPVLAASLQGQCRGTFPSFGRKTDQERIENCVRDVFERNVDSKFEVTLKLDGSSCSVYYKDGEVGICSRNMNLKLNEENAGNSFIATATSTNLLDALTKLGRNIMVQGELMGPSIQGNRENFKEFRLYVFDIFNIDKYEYMGVAERMETFSELRALGFTGEHIPVLYENVLLRDIGITDVASSKVFVDRKSINAPVAEGCVFKRIDGQFSFKSISHKFLLKYGE